ncbi:MAG: hypothetical protein ACYCY6_01640 [Minisyncoccota bacterium]
MDPVKDLSLNKTQPDVASKDAVIQPPANDVMQQDSTNSIPLPDPKPIELTIENPNLPTTETNPVPAPAIEPTPIIQTESDSVPASMPEQVGVKSTQTETEQEITSLKQIRTFEGDVADAIKKQNESLISIHRAEEKKRDAIKTLAPDTEKKPNHHEGVKALGMAILTIIFIAGGGYGAYYAFNTYNVITAPPPDTTPVNQFIGAGVTTDIDASTLTRDETISLVSSSRSTPRDANAIEHLELRRGTLHDSELLSTESFLTRLASNAPRALIRSFNDLFMLGILGSNPAHTILLIKLDSFENAFPGMLEWESKLRDDILPLFASTERIQTVPLNPSFEDKTIQNHDARVMKNMSGETVLIYGFFDNSILIITDEEETFRTIINRLQSEKLSR